MVVVHVGLQRARDDFDEKRSNETIMLFGKNFSSGKHQAPVVQRVDSAIHWINLYTVDSSVHFVNSYPLDSDLSVG